MKISCVVLAKNEENNIGDCLKTLNWCDETLVIDDKSIDRTKDIAKESGAKVFTRSSDGNFAAQRNFGLERSSGDWVFFLDADERVFDAFVFEVRSLVDQPSNQYCGFYMIRIDFMWGRELKHGEVGNMKLLRLAQKNKGEWRGKVHEEWKVKGRIGELKSPILHYPHPTISDFLKEINFYSDIRAKELYEKNVKTNFLSIIIYPKAKFIKNYIFKWGFLDGVPGLIYASMMSFHSFLVRGKLWSLRNK